MGVPRVLRVLDAAGHPGGGADLLAGREGRPASRTPGTWACSAGCWCCAACAVSFLIVQRMLPMGDGTGLGIGAAMLTAASWVAGRASTAGRAGPSREQLAKRHLEHTADTTGGGGVRRRPGRRPGWSGPTRPAHRNQRHRRRTGGGHGAGPGGGPGGGGGRPDRRNSNGSTPSPGDRTGRTGQRPGRDPEPPGRPPRVTARTCRTAPHHRRSPPPIPPPPVPTTRTRQRDRPRCARRVPGRSRPAAGPPGSGGRRPGPPARFPPPRPVRAGSTRRRRRWTTRPTTQEPHRPGTAPGERRTSDERHHRPGHRDAGGVLPQPRRGGAVGTERPAAGALGARPVHGGGGGQRPARVGLVAAVRRGADRADRGPVPGTVLGRRRAGTGGGGSAADGEPAHFPGRTGAPPERRRRRVRPGPTHAAGGVVPVAVRVLPGRPGQPTGVHRHRHRRRHRHRGAGRGRHRRGVDRHRHRERPGHRVRVAAGRPGPGQRAGREPADPAPGDPRPGRRGVAGGPPARRGRRPVRPAGLPGAPAGARRRRAAARVVRGAADRPVPGHRVGEGIRRRPAGRGRVGGAVGDHRAPAAAGLRGAGHRVVAAAGGGRGDPQRVRPGVGPDGQTPRRRRRRHQRRRRRSAVRGGPGRGRPDVRAAGDVLLRAQRPRHPGVVDPAVAPVRRRAPRSGSCSRCC